MAPLTIRLHRADFTGSPAALVAAWLIDALASAEGVSLTCANSDLIMLDVLPLDTGTSVHDIVNIALAESRFAGWHVLVDDAR